MDNDLSKTHFQNIIITIEDGSEIVASIPARYQPGDIVVVESVQLTIPAPLPPGIYWYEELHGVGNKLVH